MTSSNEYSSLGAFLRLWFVMLFSFALIKLLFNVGWLGYIDLRDAVFMEIFFLPLGQAAVFWIVTRRGRRWTAGRQS